MAGPDSYQTGLCEEVCRALRYHPTGQKCTVGKVCAPRDGSMQAALKPAACTCTLPERRVSDRTHAPALAGLTPEDIQMRALSSVARGRSG